MTTKNVVEYTCEICGKHSTDGAEIVACEAQHVLPKAKCAGITCTYSRHMDSRYPICVRLEMEDGKELWFYSGEKGE